ncbi:MAG: hypothetical protein A4E72_00745 [Syntrophus sp. PtaU1.Bin208]|nr:MAG: hypothetical protein A4E72_00745 [Syntrophus sp. PtaU1.Bin208]
MTKKPGTLFLTLVLALLFLASGIPVMAEEPSADNMQILHDKIKADKKLLVAENMQLNEKEGKAFWPVYESYQNEQFLLRMRVVKLIKDYGDVSGKMNNKTAKKLLDELMTIETLGLELRKAYLPKFRKVLPDMKVVRYYQIENKIKAVVDYQLAARIPLIQTEKK